MVKYINQSAAKIVSIDLPSGLMSEDNSYNISANIIRADLTLTLQQKKLSMMMADNQQYLGRIKVLDIRLSPEFIQRTESRCSILEEKDIRQLLNLAATSPTRAAWARHSSSQAATACRALRSLPPEPASERVWER